MLRYLLTFLAFTAPTFAQEVNLTTIPPGYSFVSEGNGEQVAVRFIRREGDRFLFKETVVYGDKSTNTVMVWLNAQSQTMAWGATGDETRYSPHDCAPSEGTCFYTWFHPDNTYEMKTITYVDDDVWVSDEYFKDGDAWVFWERDCTIYDEFGFWVDFVRIESDGITDFGARVRPEGNRLDTLWAICQPPLLTS
ncbi:MAG: hypothetical protein COB08_007840 [Rhodobacteraceae bacterium]|nr:hypothetical protein [Paracoccaceae bacterium]